MMKKHLILLAVLVATLTLLLSGCASGDDPLEGKYIATFELNGGTLDYGASSISTKVNYAYDPGTYVIDPATIDGYQIFRDKYIFTGWYTTPECNESDKWDFSKQPLNTEQLTLYAGWKKAILYTYTIYYMEGNEQVQLGSYEVKAGEVFDDWRNYANKRADHTCVGYFTDSACTTAWDFKTAHPGGEVDTDIAVYVKHIPGVWKIANSYETLKSAVSSGNVYLTADIDCGGQELFFSGTFNKVFQGNGYTVSNFTVPKKGDNAYPACSLFQSLGEKADIQNVNFTNVTYSFVNVNENALDKKVAALAGAANNAAKITNVTVSGTLKTNLEGELPRLNEAIYDESSAPVITDFSANIIVEKQNN